MLFKIANLKMNKSYLQYKVTSWANSGIEFYSKLGNQLSNIGQVFTIRHLKNITSNTDICVLSTLTKTTKHQEYGKILLSLIFK